MPRYFFDLLEGDRHLSDDLGSVCADDSSAIAYAWKTLAACIADPVDILPWQSAEIGVRRDDGLHVGRISMTIEVETRNPATEAQLTTPAVNGRPVSGL